MASCGKCGSENKDGAKFCKSCGIPMAELAVSKNSCLSCSAPLVPGAKFCKKCGTTVASSSSPEPLVIPSDEKSPVTLDGSASRICISCSTSLVPGAKFCKKCGTTVAETSLSTSTSVPSPESPREDSLPLPLVATPMTAPEPAPAHREPPVSANSPAIADSPITPVPVTDARLNAQPPISTSKSSRLVIGISLLLVVAIAGGGGFLWWETKKSDTIEAPVPTEAVKAVVAIEPSPTTVAESPLPHQDVAPVVTAAPEPVAVIPAEKPISIPEPAPTPSPEPAIAEAPTTAQKPVAVVKSAPSITKNAKTLPPTGVPDAMSSKIAALLAKANGYIANGQYDKAIATAESVLELDPASTGAKATRSKAKAKQMDALKSGSSIE